MVNHETCDVSLKKFAVAAIFEFFSTSNFISLHSPSTYKLSTIGFVHKVHIDVEFHLKHTLYAFCLRDKLKKKLRHINVFSIGL